MNVPEKHRAVAHAWVDGAEIETSTTNGAWVQIGNPGFVEQCDYRIKPKPKVKKWRWVHQQYGAWEDRVFISKHLSDDEASRLFNGLAQKIDFTGKEVDEE